MIVMVMIVEHLMRVRVAQVMTGRQVIRLQMMIVDRRWTSLVMSMWIVWQLNGSFRFGLHLI